MIEDNPQVVDQWDLGNGDTVIVLKSRETNQFYWHVVAPNGRNVGTGGESFVDKSHAIESAERHHPRERGGR
jgi:hypothetical protein